MDRIGNQTLMTRHKNVAAPGVLEISPLTFHHQHIFHILADGENYENVLLENMLSESNLEYSLTRVREMTLRSMPSASAVQEEKY